MRLIGDRLAAVLSREEGVVAVRSFDNADLPWAAAIYREYRADEFTELPAEVASPLIDMQFRARATGYDRQWPQREKLVILSDGRAAGWIEIA